MNEKTTASCHANVFPKYYIKPYETLKTTKKKLWKTVKANKHSKMTIAIRVSLPSISATFGLWFLCCSYLPLMLSLRKQPTFGDATTGFPAKWRLRNERRNSILMTRHYPDLGSTSDWLNQISYAARPIRSPNQIWVVTRHQYGISALVSQTSIDGETSGNNALRNNVYV